MDKFYFQKHRFHKPERSFFNIEAAWILVLALMTSAAFAQMSVSISVAPPTCADFTNGTATADVTGGTPPYTFAWSNGQTGQTTFGLGSGNISVTVTDANAQTGTATATVNAPLPIVISITPETTICAGSQGNYSATVTGGVPPYQFNWSNGDTDSKIERPTAGNHFLTITDANGCQAVGAIYISDPLVVRVITVDIVCPMWCDGSAAAEVIGGTGPFRFLWNTGDTVQILEWRPPGTYTVTVTDANGCMGSATGVIYEPDSIVVDLDFVYFGSCTNPGTADVTATASGGTPPFTYYWSTGFLGQTITGLTPGNYSLTVTDANNCKKEKSFIIDPADFGPQVTIVKNDAACPDFSNGSATANVAGGTPPYSYVWSNGVVTPAISNLSPGSYSVTVTDADGCDDAATTVIGITSGFTISIQKTDADCNGSGGSASVIVNGGAAPFRYLWSNGAATPTISNLRPGNYSVTVTDANDCEETATVTIESAPSFTLSIDKTDATCGGLNDGAATVTANGAVLPITILWNTSEVTATITDLPEGIYSVTVTDATGCKATATVRIENRIKLEVDTDSDPAICNQPAGSASVTVTGGTAPYSYLWNDPARQVTPTAVNLLPGSYGVQIVDSIGCKVSALVVVRDSGTVIAAFEYEILECYGDSALVQFTDRTTGTVLTWHWDFGNGRTSDEQHPRAVFNRVNNTVTLSVTTIEGCEGDFTDDVTINLIDISIDAGGSVCVGDLKQITLTNNNPSDVLTYMWGPSNLILAGDTTATPTINTTAVGTIEVFVKITNSIGCTITDTVEIQVNTTVNPTNPDLITYTQCEGFTIQFTNGNSGNFTWFFGDPTNPSAGSTDPNPTYTYPFADTFLVTVISNQPCPDTITKPVIVGPAPKADFDCVFDECADTILLELTDLSVVPTRITAWRWSLSNGMTSDVQNPTFTITEPGNLGIQLIIEFENGCTDTMVKQKDLRPFVSPNLPPLTICYGEPTPITHDGDSTYTYIWSPGHLFEDSTAVFPVITVTDTTIVSVSISRDTCEKQMQFIVTAPPKIELTLAGDTAVCDNNPVLVTVNSAQANRFQWSVNRDFTPVLSNNDSVLVVPDSLHFYYVMGQDGFNCRQMDSIKIVNYQFDIDLTGPAFLCLGGEGNLEVIATQVDTNMVFDWSEALAGSNPEIEPLATTAYFVTVTNRFGCVAHDSFTVEVIDLSLNLRATAEPDSIFKGETSQLTAFGDDSWAYSWEPCNTLTACDIFNPVAAPEISTVYTVTATDENGCTGTREVTVIVIEAPCDEPHLYLPNAFTPNDDEHNDVLYVRGYQVDEMYLIIFNRWGEKVFESRDQQKGWDGTHNGSKVAPDVYGFYLTILCKNGEEFFKKGNVTVLE